jgi:CRP-like cAMP-binding protein
MSEAEEPSGRVIDPNLVKPKDHETWSTDPCKVTKRTVSAGQIIFNQGEEGDAAYLVELGSVLLFQNQGLQRIELGIVKQGEMFGEMAVIDDGRRMATAVAMTDLRLTRIPRALFEKKLDASDRFVRSLLKLFMGNIRNTQNIFTRRPRSFRDEVIVLEGVADFIECYAGTVSEEHNQALVEKLARLKALNAEFRELATLIPDARNNAILEVGERFVRRS